MKVRQMRDSKSRLDFSQQNRNYLAKGPKAAVTAIIDKGVTFGQALLETKVNLTLRISIYCTLERINGEQR